MNDLLFSLLTTFSYTIIYSYYHILYFYLICNLLKYIYIYALWKKVYIHLFCIVQTYISIQFKIFCVTCIYVYNKCINVIYVLKYYESNTFLLVNYNTFVLDKQITYINYYYFYFYFYFYFLFFIFYLD